MSQVCFGVDQARIRVTIQSKQQPSQLLLEFKPKIINLQDLFIYYLNFTFEEFQKFLDQDILQLISQEYQLDQTINVTGFGAQDDGEFENFNKLFKKNLKFHLIKGRGIINALQSIAVLLNQKQDWFYRFKSQQSLINLNNFNNQIKMEQKTFLPSYPFIFINLNRSATFYKVQDQNNFTKIIGSIIGDITIESLFKLAGLEGNLNQIIEDSFVQGNNLNVDMTVSDIYGESSQDVLNIPATLIASCMGKLQTKSNKNPVNKMDVAKSIWIMFCINLGQLVAQNIKIEGITTVIINSSRIVCEPFLYLLQSTLTYYCPQVQLHYIKNSEIMTCLRL